MQNRKSFSRKSFSLFDILLLVGLLCCLLAPPSQAQAIKSFGVTNLVVNASSTLNITTNPPIQVWSGRGYSVLPKFTTAGAGTANVVFGFNVSLDGTNWSTTLPITITNACNGTTAVVGYTPVNSTVLNNVHWWRLDQIVNGQTSSLTVSNVMGGYFP